jgi:HK97 gp10 family phage protein
MDVTVTINLNGLEEKLIQLGPKLAKSTLRKALRESSKLFVEGAKSRAAVDTGDLRESIVSKVTMKGNEEKGIATVGPSMIAGLKGSAYTQSPGFYGRFVEFGVPSRQIPPAPFLRPTFDADGDKVVAKFAEVLRAGLEEAAK